MSEHVNHTIFWVGDMREAMYLSRDVNVTSHQTPQQYPSEVFTNGARRLQNNLIDKPLVLMSPEDRVAVVVMEPEDSTLEELEQVVHSARERFASTHVAFTVIDLTGRMLNADISFPDLSTTDAKNQLGQLLQTHLYPPTANA